MENQQIADCFSLLAKLLDIHGENSFKSKSYAAAAFALEKLPEPVRSLPPEKLPYVKGIGSSSAQKILEFLQTGRMASLEDILKKTPPGILEMLHIKGIGPKKIHSIWKEMGIESLGELSYACKENRLKLFKGFGEKTQQNIADSIAFYLKHKESHLYAIAEIFEKEFTARWNATWVDIKLKLTGQIARQLPVIDFLEYTVEGSKTDIESALEKISGIEIKDSGAERIRCHWEPGIDIIFYPVSCEKIIEKTILQASSPAFADALVKLAGSGNPVSVDTEESFFQHLGLPFIPAYLREDATYIPLFQKQAPPPSIEVTDIKGLIHCHTTWSDGNHSIEEMAAAARRLGMEYIVISDHSKSAFYAQGLTEDRIRAQHEQIDMLNKNLHPFKIFKGIECDILNDGSLDYNDDVLASFDVIIASVHSNLKMNADKAMERLMAAIRNPYTTILGHLTGRLLLSRNGYPVDHQKIIEECRLQAVAIELNANPHRLDIDWTYLPEVLAKEVPISINPDAHSLEGINDIYFGVLQARKGLVTKQHNLSSFPLVQFEAYLQERRQRKGI